MKVLFLDMDGVLNSRIGWKRDEPESWQYVTPECVDRLRRVLEACPDVKIVLSSTWRRHFTKEAFRAMFTAIDLPGERVIDFTPMKGLSDGVRGYEIQEWLDLHLDVTGFVIVDDTDDMVHLKPHFVLTSFVDGLTDENADNIIARFGAMK